MKEMNEAKSALKAKLDKLQEQRRRVESDIYKVEQAIESLDRISSLERIRHVRYSKVCALPACKKPFKSGKQDALYCSQKCARAGRLKGITLVRGAQK